MITAMNTTKHGRISWIPHAKTPCIDISTETDIGWRSSVRWVAIVLLRLPRRGNPNPEPRTPIKKVTNKMNCLDYLGTVNERPVVLLDSCRTVELWVEDMGYILSGDVAFGIEVDPYTNNLNHLIITNTYNGKAWLFRYEPQRNAIEYMGAK